MELAMIYDQHTSLLTDTPIRNVAMETLKAWDLSKRVLTESTSEDGIDEVLSCCMQVGCINIPNKGIITEDLNPEMFPTLSQDMDNILLLGAEYEIESHNEASATCALLFTILSR